ncbi:transposase [Haloarcula marismortui ATCC 33799]|uniref:Transposase n=1 Tax=Haloarcula marismortui ATCC 33799 TaxID=662475 RepID=M0JRH7_9EURY|nr:transposase [Haloarcula californiae ATCC 33799]
MGLAGVAALQQHPQSGHAALDSTFFDRHISSSYYRQRSGNSVQTLKVTILTDVESIAVLDVHISARWQHDTKTGPQVVRQNADDLLSVAADNGFQDWNTECEVAALDIDYPVNYRGSSLNATANNAPIRSKWYFQHRMAETSYSTIKRSLGFGGNDRTLSPFIHTPRNARAITSYERGNGPGCEKL